MTPHTYGRATLERQSSAMQATQASERDSKCVFVSPFRAQRSHIETRESEDTNMRKNMTFSRSGEWTHLPKGIACCINTRTRYVILLVTVAYLINLADLVAFITDMENHSRK